MSHEQFVLLKRGLYYRPDFQGYTSKLDDAGRYTLEEIAEHYPTEDLCKEAGLSFMLIDEAPEYAPGCLPHMKIELLEQEVEHLKARLASYDETKLPNLFHTYHVSYHDNGNLACLPVTLRGPWQTKTSTMVCQILQGHFGAQRPAILHFSLMHVSAKLPDEEIFG